jgi:hypothetical protein
MKLIVNRRVLYGVGASLAAVVAAVCLFWRASPNFSALLKQKAPYHARYAKTGALIEKRDYLQALKEARSLRIALEADKQLWREGRPGRILYAFNLLRIAALQREVGTPQEERLALSDLEMVAVTDPETAHLLEQGFRLGEVALFDYIKQRKKFINQ